MVKTFRVRAAMEECADVRRRFPACSKGSPDSCGKLGLGNQIRTRSP